MALNAVRRSAAVGLFLAALQMALTAGVQPQLKTSPESMAESSSPLTGLHGIEKKSVSILARNGDLPYFRKEWNKKLHPGFRGMNVEDKEEESSPSKRYVGALARDGAFPMSHGKRTTGGRYEMLDGISPEEALLEAYLPAEWGPEDYPEAAEDKRGGVGSLARAGYMPYEGRYSTGKRSVAALARSGELLSIGRNSNQEREPGSGATKRGLGSILRHGGISTIGKVPVYSIGAPNSGKRGIESLARNYALPSMINQDYENKNDFLNGEDDEGELVEPLYEDVSPDDEIEGPGEGEVQEELAKRHLGSFVRTYGLRPGVKRNLGSIVRNYGAYHHGGKRNDAFYPYDTDYAFNDKRHFSSLLKNQAGYTSSKRDFDDGTELSEMEKRHLGSILHGKRSLSNGKRYLGSIARQGMLGNHHDKRESLEGAFDDGPWNRGDYNVGKRSISEGESDSFKSDESLDEHGNLKVKNGTAEDELKNAAQPSPFGGISRKSGDQDNGNKKLDDDGSANHRQRRSLSLPYSTSDEYPMPVLQNTDFYNLENEDEEELADAPGKRFMGRIPHMGRSRPRAGSQTQSASRRRPRYY